MEQFQALIGLAPWTMIFTLLNLMLTIYVVKHFFFERIQLVLEQRKELAVEKLREADEAKEEAFAMKKRWEKDMETSREKAREILAVAKKEASNQSEAMLREAEERIRWMKNQAEKEIAGERKTAAEELKKEIGAIAMLIAAKVLEREIREKDHERMVGEFLQNVGDKA